MTPKTNTTRSAVACLAVSTLALGCAEREVVSPVDASKAEYSGVIETIEVSRLEDKIRGGWAGQMIGVSFGAPTEFRYLGRVIPEDELPEWQPGMVKNSIRQDDLYVDMTFMAVLDDKGWDATTEDFGAAFRDSQYPLWHANYAARRALRRGVPASDTGSPTVNPHANDIDFQIEADFIGLMTPGMPSTAIELAQRVGRVMNAGDGILGGIFVGGLYSAAFFDSEPRKIVEAGLAVLPADSPYAEIISDTLRWSQENPSDWVATWQLIEDHHGGGDVCPQGAMRPFNIDAKLNGAYIALGLLYGDGDVQKTMEISARAGQDSDCNPASAVGVLGVVLGYEGIPERYRAGIPAMAHEKFAFTSYSFESIVASNVDKAVAAVLRNGGQMSGGELQVPIQVPLPAQVEIWRDHGDVLERIAVDDRRVELRGPWKIETVSRPDSRLRSASASAAGAEATVTFEGTGVIVTAAHKYSGGTVEVVLDGQVQGVFDTFSEEGEGNPWNTKSSESVWHRFGLDDKEHVLQLRVTGEPYAREDVTSGGSDFTMQDVVVFR
jgi:hypothetical protein